MNKTAQEEMMPVAEFSKMKGTSVNKVVEMIRDGFYVGRKVGDEWFIDKSEVLSNDKKQPSNDEVNNAKSIIIFGAVLIAIGFLIYANGEQIGLSLLGGEEQLQRDALRNLFNQEFHDKAKSIGNFLQFLYSGSIAVGLILVAVGAVKSKK